MKGKIVYFLGWGVILWLVATIFFRLVGQFLLNPESLALLIVTFVTTVPVIAAVTYPVYTKGSVAHSERPAAAICVALPGMLVDVLVLPSFGAVFPNLSALSGSADALFGAWLLWAYALILLSGLFPPQPQRTA